MTQHKVKWVIADLRDSKLIPVRLLSCFIIAEVVGWPEGACRKKSLVSFSKQKPLSQAWAALLQSCTLLSCIAEPSDDRVMCESSGTWWRKSTPRHRHFMKWAALIPADLQQEAEPSGTIVMLRWVSTWNFDLKDLWNYSRKTSVNEGKFSIGCWPEKEKSPWHLLSRPISVTVFVCSKLYHLLKVDPTSCH